MRKAGFVLILMLLCNVTPACGEPSPHVEALMLVLRSRQPEIAKVDPHNEKLDKSPDTQWWFDTDERQWIVQRPFGPGTIDTTHAFVVKLKGSSGQRVGKDKVFVC